MAEISINELCQTEQATLGQHICDLWKQLHIIILTSSNFKRVCSSEKSISDSFVGSLLDPPDLSHLPAIQHGRYYEGVAASCYLALHVTSGIPISMRTCGLVLHTKYRFLGASPDCLVNVWGLLEIKCPYSVFITQACSNPHFCCKLVDGRPQLKEGHEYMYQIQGQLAIAGIEWCDLMVWLGFLPEQMHIQRISYNSIFWEQHMLPTLHSFYYNDIITYIP